MDEKVQVIYKILQESCHNLSNICENEFSSLFISPIRKKSLPFSISHDTGASKGVILIEDSSEVIKIPFRGYYDESSYSYACREAREKNTKDPDYEDFFYEFEGAYCDELDITPSWDYCKLESLIYERATEEGLKEYFAEEYYLGSIDCHPIYAQTKARIYCDRYDSTRHSKEKLHQTSKKCEELDVYCFNEVWISDFIDIYGEEEFARLMKFIEKYQIGDLHDGNIGYIDGIPVLVDYSDYRG